MVGRDALELGAVGVGADTAEELAGLPFPAEEILAEDRLLAVVRNFGGAEVFAVPAEEKVSLTCGTKIADPLRVTPWGDEISLAVKFEEVHGRAPCSPGLAAPNLENARAQKLRPARVSTATSRLKTLRVNQSGGW